MVLTTLLILPQGMLPSSASPASTKYSLSASPTRIQEGFNTNITVSLQEANISTTYTVKVNVTSPNSVSYSSNVTVVTDKTGAGSNLTKFWSDFVNATTDYVGIYRIALNETLATSNFTVGLTDKLKYFRSETVNIRGSGYARNETVIVDLKFGNASVLTFPRSINASPEGVVTSSWQVPVNASLGVYTITISNATTGGTVKTPADFQTFTVEGLCEIQARTPANETVAGVAIEVYNATTGVALNILPQETNKTGWVSFILSGGNYTFKAFWKNVEVGAVNKTVTENAVMSLTVWLSNIKLTVTDEAVPPHQLPWIDLNLKYNLTLNGITLPVSKTNSFTTNVTGSIQIMNMFTNISYLMEASRYGFIFNTTSVKNLTAGWNNITIVAPTYTMFVNVLDSKNAPAADLRLLAYDWNSSQIAQQGNTDERGNVTLPLTFGRYRLRLYKDDAFLKEVTVDLLNQSLTQYFFVIHIDVYKVDLNVRVVDYFGQPIPNVLVVFQRKVDSNYTIVENETTASDGVAWFHNIIGGDSRVSVSVAGRPGETQYLYLADSKQIVFKLDGYVAVAGYALDTSQFVTVLILLIIIVAFIIASTYKRLPRLLHRRRK
jgi:5-hydroxyisourate hydrolase-like protein (transthyretin family)